jgi:hypothetical protein
LLWRNLSGIVSHSFAIPRQGKLEGFLVDHGGKPEDNISLRVEIADILGAWVVSRILKMVHIFREAMPPVHGDTKVSQPRGAVGKPGMKV